MSDSASATTCTKKLPLEELSHDQLVQKCKNLLTIAQKAKQAKDEAQQERNAIKEQLGVEKNTNSQLTDALQKLTEQKSELIIKLHSAQEAIERSSSQTTNQEKLFKELEARNEELETNNVSLTRQISRLSNENESLLCKLDELENRLKCSDTSENEKNKSLEVDASLQRKLEESELIIANLTDELKSLKDLGATEKLAGLHKQLDKIELLKTKAIEENASLQLELEDLKIRERNHLADIEELNRTIIEIQKNEHTERELSETPEQLTRLSNEIDDIHRLILEINPSENGENQEKSDASNTPVEVSEMNSRVLVIKFKIKELIDTLESLKRTNSCIETENEHYKVQLSAYESEKLDLLSDKEKHTQLQDELLRVKDSLASTETLLINKSKQLKEANANIKSLKSQHADLLNILKNYFLLIEEWKEKMKTVVSKYESETCRFFEEKKEFEAVIDAMTKEKSKCDSKIAELEEVLSGHRVGDDKSAEKIAELESSLSESNSKNKELLEELNHMNEILKERGEIISQERAQIEKLQEKLLSFENKNIPSTVVEEKTKSEPKEAETEIAADDSDIRSTSTISRAEDIGRFKELDSSWEEKYAKLRNLALKYKAKIRELTAELENKKSAHTKSDHLDHKLEQESNVIVVKELESRITKLEQLVEEKKKGLEKEIEAHKETKEKLAKSDKEIKKKSVLSLEIDNYEKSLKELSMKFEQKKEIIQELEDVIDSQKSTISQLKDRIRSLDTSLELEKDEVKRLQDELQTKKHLLNERDATVSQKEARIQEILRCLEETKCQYEDVSAQLAEIIQENQRKSESFKEEKTNMNAQVLGYRDKVKLLTENLKSKEEELLNVQTEFAKYKVRAQSVLKQNMSKEVGVEERLSEENFEMKNRLDILAVQIKELNETNHILREENNVLAKEKDAFSVRCKELMSLIDEQRKIHDTAMKEQKKQMKENTEILKTQKLHTDTLVQSYKQQITEMEEMYTKEIADLKEQLSKNILTSAPGSPHSEEKIDVFAMEREECEGSESVTSINNQLGFKAKQNSLEYLLSVDDIDNLKKELTQQNMKITHLTALLADTEQDLAKHVQLNQLLKEEIRRQQRSVEREKHAENLEYLKNVIFKFLTLNNGDEKSRLIPVLNTILKLSPEETHKLLEATKDDSAIKKIGSFIPWPGK